MDAVCETAQLLATRLGFDPVVQQGLGQIFEHWDGKGLPGRVVGEEIVLPARFVAIAELFEGMCRLRGPDDAVAAVRDRRGTAFAPELVDCLCAEADALQPIFEQEPVWDTALDSAPLPGRPLGEAELADALAAIADFTDLKSTYTFGHSRGVSELAEAAGRAARLPDAEVRATRWTSTASTSASSVTAWPTVTR